MIEAHIYLLGMENGKVKVGSSKQPAIRIVGHRTTIGKVSPIVDEWVSDAHRDYLINERKIVLFMGGTGEIATANYAEVLAYAKTLKYKTTRRRCRRS